MAHPALSQNPRPDSRPRPASPRAPCVPYTFSVYRNLEVVENQTLDNLLKKFGCNKKREGRRGPWRRVYLGCWCGSLFVGQPGRVEDEWGRRQEGEEIGLELGRGQSSFCDGGRSAVNGLPILQTSPGVEDEDVAKGRGGLGRDGGAVHRMAR